MAGYASVIAAIAVRCTNHIFEKLASRLVPLFLSFLFFLWRDAERDISNHNMIIISSLRRVHGVTPDENVTRT
jgi:hypothetical protein